MKKINLGRQSHDITFNEQDHIYMLDGEIANYSTTQLLAKHHLANDYTNVDVNVLKNKATYGTNVHKDIESIINDNNYKPTTKEGELFKEWAKGNLTGAIAEQLLGIEYKGLTICGSCDLLGFMVGDTRVIIDHKTYAQMTNETKYHISWQESIYDFMARHCDIINGKMLNWQGAEKYLVLWYKKDKETKEISLEVVEINPISDDEIIKLFECELNGETYKPNELVIPNELSENLIQTEIKMAEYEIMIKEYKELQKKYREALKEAMIKQDIISWESPNGLVKVTLSPETTRDGVDTKKLKKERPDIYKKYAKPSKVSASVRVSTDYEKYKELTTDIKEVE